MMQYAPPYQPNRGSGLDVLMFLEMMKQRQQAPKAGMGGGAGLDSLLGGGAGAGGASMLGGGAGAGAGGMGAAGAAGADLGIGAPAMMMPEMTPLAPSMASGGGAAGLGGTAAGLSPMLGMASVVAAPLIGSMIGKRMIGKNPYKSREYSAEDFGKRSKLPIKGFDKTDENTRRQIGDKLREYKGERKLTFALDRLDGKPSDRPDWNFQLPDMVQKKVNAKVFGGDNKWGNLQSQSNLMKDHTASELFDMGKDAMLNRKHRDQIGGILGQVDELIKKGQGAGLSPQPQKVTPMGHTTGQINGMKRRR